MTYIVQQLGRREFDHWFRTYVSGPYSQQLYVELLQLKAWGLVSETEYMEADGSEEFRYSLTEEGRNFLREREIGLEPNLAHALRDLSNQRIEVLDAIANSMHLTRLSPRAMGSILQSPAEITETARREAEIFVNRLASLR
jgi:uncharacterized protein YwgA